MFGDADTVVAARVRPLVGREVEMGCVAGVVERGYDGCVDVFELRNKVTGRPAVIVRLFSPLHPIFFLVIPFSSSSIYV